MNTYQELGPIGREEALRIFTEPDPQRTTAAILRLALNDPDGEWVTKEALELTKRPEASIRAVAATALGHIARIHRRIDQGPVVEALTRLLADPETAGRAEDALDDIEVFASHKNEP